MASRAALTLITALLAATAGSVRAAGVDRKPARIASLAPSNTELVFSLHAERQLVGVSSFCDFPPAAKRIARVGSFTAANLERLTSLKPDTVLLVSGQESMAGSLKARGFNVILLDNGRLSRLPDNLKTVGRLTGRSRESAAIAEALAAALDELSTIIARAKGKPRVFYCVWPQPLMAVGGDSFLNDEITAAGGTNLAADLKAPYPHFSVERLLVLDPEVIVMPHEAVGQAFLTRPPWTSLQAFARRRVFYLPPPDKNDLARPTLRALDGIHWLAVRFHPELKGDLAAWLDRSRERLAAAGLTGPSRP